MVDAAVASFGRLDWAFNNAGIAGPRDAALDGGEEIYDRIMDINVKGVWLCMRYELPIMKQVGGGVIVNTASAAGLVGSATRPIYSASKHAVVGLTRSVALAYAGAKIRVNAICPGTVDTAIVADLLAQSSDPAALLREMKAANPSGRIGTPEEIAAAVVWLCSDASSFVTGHALVIDGGATAG